MAPPNFYVPIEVLITRLATTTVDVIGLFVIVVKYLFHTANKQKKTYRKQWRKLIKSGVW
jgi:hypothetical protein